MYTIDSKEKFEKFVIENWNSINTYIDEASKELPIPIYSSVDIRESRLKFAPVDHNMYPAGFNNICNLDLEKGTEVFEETILRDYPESKNIAIIPESHTKNTFYLDHLAFLGRLVRDAGFTPCFVGLDENLFEDEQNELNLISHSKFDIKIIKGRFIDHHLYAHDLKIDVAILNNDQSNPLNYDWEQVKTPIIPTPKIGWFKREKIKHFEFYSQVVENFSQKFNIDSNLLQAKFKNECDIDFMTKEGIERLANEVDTLLEDLPKGSNVFVKASQGTYGMGISVVKSGDDVMTMNRKARNKMDIGKNKIKFTSVLIQEGIETILKYDDMPAEVAIYLIDGKSIGGFMRANNQRDAFSNLNSKGMVFKKYCISEIRENSDHQQKEAVYSIIARLATLAAAFEIKEVL